ncbi:MAG TPA: hypothetical protein VGE07_24540 [Herpetosiphonaceae bacterium]
MAKSKSKLAATAPLDKPAGSPASDETADLPTVAAGDAKPPASPSAGKGRDAKKPGGKPAAPAEDAPSAAPAAAPRPWRTFVFGWLAGALSAPVLVWLALLLLTGTNAARQGTASPPEAPDIQVLVSPAYMERSLAAKQGFSNPRITLGPHPVGGAALTLTVGIDVPLLGVRDVQTRNQIVASEGRLVVVTEQAGLGEEGGLRLPGRLVEGLISGLVNEEIDKRLKSNPALEIDVVGVSAAAGRLQVDARLKQK